jgi:hypothetical protein
VAAVLQALDTLTGARDLTPYEPVIDRADRYVRRYTVLERETTGEVTRVRPGVSLRSDQLVRDVAALAVASYRTPPTVSLLLLEQLDDRAPHPLRDEEMLKRLTEPFDPRSFRVQPFPWHLYETDTLAERLDGKAAETASLATQTLTDILLAGWLRMRVEPPAPGTNLAKCRARLTVSVYTRDGEESLGEANAEVLVQSVSPREGLEQARRDVAMKLARDVFYQAALAAVRLQRADDVVIDLEGTPPERLADEVSEAVRSVWGVDEAEILVSTPALVRLRVRYDGPLDPLLDALLDTPFSGAVIDMQRVVGRRVNLRVTGAQTENRREPLRAPAGE